MSDNIVKEVTSQQKRIVAAARKIIGLQGIGNLTVREIAKELKLTDGAIYRHFKSKKEIISLLIDDIEETLLDVVKCAAENSDGYLQKLADIFSAHLSYAERRKGITFIIINETLSIKDKTLQRKMFTVVNEYIKMIKEILAEGLNSGELRKDLNLVSASIAFFGMVQAMVTIWALSGFRYSLTKSRLDEMFNVYIIGVAGK